MKENAHLTEDAMEQLVLGKLAPEEINRAEDHLLLCEPCRMRVDETRRYVEATRLAAKRIRTEELDRASRRRWWQQLFDALSRRPAWSLAGVALALLLVWLPSQREEPFQYQEVRLHTVRGVDLQPISGSRNTRLRLVLDGEDLPRLPEYRIQVVDGTGRPQFESTVSGSAATADLEVKVDKKLDRGQYWVRVLDPADESRPLREYSLPLQ